MERAQHWNAGDAAGLLPRPTARDHKYSRGVLGLRTGSAAYPGAAVLSAEAAWRTGIGLVSFAPQLGDDAPGFGLPSPAAAVLAARPETVISAANGRCDAWLIGSGTDPERRSPEELGALRTLLAGDAPVVADAGALDRDVVAPRAGAVGAGLLGAESLGAESPDAPRAPLLLTPHAGEFARLCDALGIEHSGGAGSARAGAAGAVGSGAVRSGAVRSGAAPAAASAALALAARLGATVLLKGSTTLVASPSGSLLTVGPATPWLATAGTGDVLAGILGALTAAHAAAVRADPDLLARLAATGALLHDAAARLAARDPAGEPLTGGLVARASRPITAMDVARALPEAVAQLSHHTG